MIEIWNEFCSYLIDCRKRNVSEERYHEIIESQLSLLNWKRFKGEICHKERIPSGHGFAEPDIVIKKDNEIQMVIEVKKPNHEQTHEERLQLLSYIRLCTLRVGLYIGEHIEFFFDQQGNSSEPVSAYKIPIELDCDEGRNFVELMMRDNFTKDGIVDFCENKIREQQNHRKLNHVRKELIDGSFGSFLSDSIKQHLLYNDDYSFSEQQIDDMLTELEFKVIPKGKPLISETVIVPKRDDFVINGEEYNTTKSARDKTKYSLDGGDFLAKNRFALAVVKKYVRLHPDKNYDELERIFPYEWVPGWGVIHKLDNMPPKYNNNRRYFTESSNIISDKNGLKFAVTTQWKKDNIMHIVGFAKRQGWDVKENK